MKVCSVCLRCFEDSALSCSEVNHDILTEAREGSCEVIPNYRLDFLEDISAASETYRAANTILDKPYLVKILAPGTFDEAAKKQFLAEAQSLAAIIHPNVARIFESGVLADGSLYIVTEYFTAQTLRECLVNVGAPSEVTALTITRQAAEGLEAIHAVGVSHRGIRPENIILTADAENKFLVKLQNIDFGGIRQKQVISNGDLHLPDLRYFSPEQCAAEDAGAQTDVYGLGVVLYEILAGQVPFDAPYADALIAKQIKETPPEVKIKSFDIRMLLTHTLTDALQKTARTRLKTANAFARRIRHIEQLATHSSTPPPAMSYPAKMDKAAVVFTPPAKPEKPVAALKTKRKSIVKELPVIETQAALENFAAVDIPTVVDDPPLTEAPAIVETPVMFEAQSVIEELPLNEPETVVENLLTAEDLPVVEAQTVDESPVAGVELQTLAEDAPFAENQTVIEDLSLVEDVPIAGDLPVAEDETLIETAVFTENEITADELLLAENEAVVENVDAAETQAAENAFAAEIPAVFENPVFIENEAIGETPAVFENELPVETAVLAETRPAVENQLPIEARTAYEDPDEIEILTVAEEPAAVEIQTVAEAPAPPVTAFDDYSTTKLPPLESVLEIPSPADDAEVETVMTLKAKGFDIHKTSEEPVRIEWEQPDDVPTTTQALNTKKKEFADTVFVSNAGFIDDDADIIDAGEADSVSQDSEPRRNYAAELPVFSYQDTAGKAWKLPEKRTILTGGAILGLLILAVGGMFLSRQFQTARLIDQTAAKSLPNDNPLPKSAEPDEISETGKLSTVKPADLNVNDADNPEVPEVPDYQPRAASEEKTVVPVSQTRSKKRPVNELSEKRDKQVPTKTVSNEVFDKKGNVKPAADKKTAVKNQVSTPTKSDIFTRPRVVKNPKF